jgi:ornithine decarboxylase
VAPKPPPLDAYMDEIKSSLRHLPVAKECEIICEPGRALVAEAESVVVRVDARKGNHLYINDGAFGTLFDAAHSGITFPARVVEIGSGEPAKLRPFSLYGPTCDSSDHMPGPYLLPGNIEEGDFVEIGQIGAYGRVLATGFNGCGNYDEAILLDEPLATMYPAAPANPNARAVGQ